MSSQGIATPAVRAALSLPTGGHRWPAIIHLALILAWHCTMVLASLSADLSGLSMRASWFWYRTGVTHSYISRIKSRPMAPALYEIIAASAVLVVLEATLGSVVYLLFVRRPRPRWYHYVRFWWRTCAYGTLLVLGILVVPAALPFSWPSDELFVVLLPVFFLAAPVWFAKREAARRARRIARLCPVCRYWLHGIAASICPECGTPLVRGDRGGFVVDRVRVRALLRPLRSRWRTAVRVLLLLVAGAVIGQGLRVGVRAWSDRFAREDAATVNTARGPARSSWCSACDSARVVFLDGSVEYPIQGAEYGRCPHVWSPESAARPNWRLTDGDVLLVRKGGRYNAVKVLNVKASTSMITFEWFHQPNKAKGTFTDSAVLRGKVSWVSQIAFRDVKIDVWDGRISYDFCYGGIDPRAGSDADPHYIAFAGKADVSTLDAADPGWIYKTWEDGKPNGYERDSRRVDLRLTEVDRRALEAIWRHISPGLKPRDDDELARFRHVLATDILAEPRAYLPPGAKFASPPVTVWPAIRDDLERGGRPGRGNVWRYLRGYRVAVVSTLGSGRRRGLVQPAPLITADDASLTILTDAGSVELKLSAVHFLAIGPPAASHASTRPSPTGAATLHTVPVRVRTADGRLVDGLVRFQHVWRSGLEFWFYPFVPSATTPAESPGMNRLMPRLSDAVSTDGLPYEWIAFADGFLRTCPKCGEPAESVAWSVCPRDGTKYE